MNWICNVLKENEPTNIKNDTLISLSSNLDSKLLRLFFFFFFFGTLILFWVYQSPLRKQKIVGNLQPAKFKYFTARPR